MALAVDRAQRSLRKLHKWLQKLPADPSPEEVHRLRTLARHIETIAAVLAAPDQKRVRQLLESIKPLRKAAGRVRELDVFIGHAVSLPPSVGRDSLRLLVACLMEMRQKSSGKLLYTVRRRQKTAQRRIKQYSEFIGSAATEESPSSASGTRAHTSQQRIQTVVAEIMRDLSHGPPPDPRNLHRLRLKIKKLRSILQLLPRTDRGLRAALDRAKNALGEWHDRQQLYKMAAQSLNARRDRALLDCIASNRQPKLENALIAAHALREHCQKPRDGKPMKRRTSSRAAS